MRQTAIAQAHGCCCHPKRGDIALVHLWTIRKSRRGKRTATTIQLLAEADRVDELASMLRGEARGETTRQEAAAMLAAAKGRR